MSDLIIGIIEEDECTYQAELMGHYGVAKPILDLNGAEDVTEGLLGEDKDSAYILAEFLLEHQEAGLLPPIIEIADVVAAYDYALERFEELKK